MICNELPGMVDMLRFFEIYDRAAEGFKITIEQGDLQRAAEFQQVMFRCDCWLSEKKFEQ